MSSPRSTCESEYDCMVTSSTFDKILASKNGIFVYSDNIPQKIELGRIP